MNILNTWQFNLFGYLVGMVTFFQFYKLAVRNAHRDGAATILLQIIASMAVLFLAPFFPFTYPTDWRVYLMLAVACIFYALNDRLQTTSIKNLQISIFSIINQLTNVFLILIGLTVFREPFIWTKIIGAGLILAGNILLFYRQGKLKLNKYAWIGVLASLVLTIGISIDIGISKQFNIPFYIMLTLFLPALMIFAGGRIKLSEVLAEFKGENKRYYLITGIAWALTVFFSLRAFQLGKVTTIVPLQATSVLLNVIVAYLIFGERKDRLRKLAAACLVILGVYFTVAK